MGNPGPHLSSSSGAAPDPTVLRRFANIVGDRHALRDASDITPFVMEWRDLYHGRTPLVLRPGSVDEVAAILQLANETRTPVVPQGGNTGLVGAQVPDDSGLEVVLSLKRLNRIRSVDPAGNTMTVEAGVVLQSVQDAADTVDRLFPLSLGSEGSCTIGGNLSSNAGGTGVLAYGNARDLVLGLEVVLASGEIWHGLRSLRKDNTGYDLKHLFIGGEGTLGVITAAVLKLFPKPKARAVAMVACQSTEASVALFNRLKATVGSNLTAFELMCRPVMELAFEHTPGARDPFESVYPWYCLTEISVGTEDADPNADLEAALDNALEAEEAVDAVIALSQAQAGGFWAIRHALSEVQEFAGGSIKHDVSVPVAGVPELLARGRAAAEAVVPGCRPMPFGHLGDGNIHFNISQPDGMEKAAFLDRWNDMNEAIHGVVHELGGSISAEHGIGRLKRDLLARVKSPVELDMMRSIKKTLDPHGILNPGRMI